MFWLDEFLRLWYGELNENRLQVVPGESGVYVVLDMLDS